LATVVGLIALVLVNAETLTAPRDDLAPGRPIPPIYATLAREPQAIVLEVPFWSCGDVQRNGSYIFNSTSYWHPLVNGYSGFTPDSYAHHATLLERFPDAASVEMLRTLGVTHVVVHTDEAPDVATRILAWPSLELVASDQVVQVYRTRHVPVLAQPPRLAPERGYLERCH
jgi:hypothetical protein